MKVTLLFFAAARDASGTAEAVVDLPGSVTRIAEFLTWLGESYPSLVPYLGAVRIAQNEVFAAQDDLIQPSAVLAVIPPVAGG